MIDRLLQKIENSKNAVLPRLIDEMKKAGLDSVVTKKKYKIVSVLF